jgi:hypothetical protein
MNELTKAKENSLDKVEADAIGKAAMEDAGFERLLKFKKGKYETTEGPVNMGVHYVAHCVGWTKVWVKFVDSKVVDRKVYRVIAGEIPVERDQLDDNNSAAWPMGPMGKPSDPWVYQYLLPLEDPMGDVLIFTTASIGGKRAIADLCKSYSRRVGREGVSEQPVVKLGVAVMPTKMFGDVQRPLFEIVGWDSARSAVREVKVDQATAKPDFDDAIPY